MSPIVRYLSFVEKLFFQKNMLFYIISNISQERNQFPTKSHMPTCHAKNPYYALLSSPLPRGPSWMTLRVTNSRLKPLHPLNKRFSKSQSLLLSSIENFLTEPISLKIRLDKNFLPILCLSLACSTYFVFTSQCVLNKSVRLSSRSPYIMSYFFVI